MSTMNLNSGYDIIINQNVGGVATPIYPITKASNIYGNDGTDLVTLLAGKAPVVHGNHVPAFDTEVTSSLKFLRNDNTWAEIQHATTEQAGVVQLSNSTSADDATTAATSKAVKAAYDLANSAATAMDNYIPLSQRGAANGVATLDATGLIPASQLPSYVDDVVEGYLYEGKFYEDEEHNTEIAGESSKIYVELESGKTYRFSGTAFVVISETLALGITSSTAFRGDYGQTAYEHSQATHARVDATAVTASENNGYIQVNGTEMLVYTHPGTGTNPHGTTASDVGLGALTNDRQVKGLASGTTVDHVVTFGEDGYTVKDSGFTIAASVPANAMFTDTTYDVATQSAAGLMSATDKKKVDDTTLIAVAAEKPTFDCLWMKIVTPA